MFDELETIVLTKDIKEHNLKKGDIGTVVHRYKDKKAFEVEFVTAEGKTLAAITLSLQDIRPMAKHEIFHARGFVAGSFPAF